jgi:hypothetical protein
MQNCQVALSVVRVPCGCFYLFRRRKIAKVLIQNELYNLTYSIFLAKKETKVQKLNRIKFSTVTGFGQKKAANTGCFRFADRTGLEPATSAVTGRHSNQLNYRSRYLLCCWGCKYRGKRGD